VPSLAYGRGKSWSDVCKRLGISAQVVEVELAVLVLDVQRAVGTQRGIRRRVGRVGQGASESDGSGNGRWCSHARAMRMHTLFFVRVASMVRSFAKRIDWLGPP